METEEALVSKVLLNKTWEVLMIRKLVLVLLFVISFVVPLQAAASTAPNIGSPETFICRVYPSLPFCRGGW